MPQIPIAFCADRGLDLSFPTLPAPWPLTALTLGC